MFTVLLSTTTSALFGISDFLGGLASRRESAIAVTAASHAIGVVLFALAVLLFPAPLTSIALVAGVTAGVSGGVGVAALYAALGRGRMSVVAPLTAALSGTLPAVYDFLRGSTLKPTSVIGLAFALVATVIVSATSGDHGEEETVGLPASAVILALVAGIGFSGSFISFSFAGAASRFWPLLAARVTSFLMLAALAFYRRRTLRIEPSVRGSVAAAGVLDATANVTMLTAIRVGPLAVASVLGSLYPVVTVLLARAFLGERLRGAQRAGVVLALAAVVLASWP